LSIWDAKSPLLLLHRSLKMLPDLPRYDLMLSPQFYVLKREALPLKYAFQAKKLAPSVLEELVGDGAVTYEVFRDAGGHWCFAAYDREGLERFLKERGGSPDRVGRIYFAEQAREHFDPPVVLSESEVLGVVNDTVTVIPSRLLPESVVPAAFDASFRPDRGFGFKRSRRHRGGESRLVVAAAVIAVLLGLAWIAEGVRYQRQLEQVRASLEEVFASDATLRGSYARNAVYRKYHTLDTTQRAIRERLKALGRLTSRATRLDRVVLDDKHYEANLSVPNDPKTVASLKTLAARGDLQGVKIASGTLSVSGKVP